MKIIIPLAFVSLVGALGCGSSNDSSPDAAVATGPGVAFKCTSSGKDAWDTYGADAFVAVNKSIFANVNTELTGPNGTTNLGTSFGQVGMGTHDSLATFEGQLAAFLVFAYGGPTSITYSDGIKYTANGDMKTAHAGFGITTAQYGYFVSNIIVPALTTNGVPSGDVSSCFAPVVTDSAFMATIVGQ